MINEHEKGAVVETESVFGPFTMLPVNEPCETGLFRHFFNRLFWSPYFPKYISYACHLFKKCSTFGVELQMFQKK